MEQTNESYNLSQLLSIFLDTEVVTIVNENNEVIGAMTRKEMRESKLFHRATYIIVTNSQNKFIVQRRSELKKWYFIKNNLDPPFCQRCPKYIDLVFGGCVQKDESYEQNAEREIEEELGVKDTKLEPLFEFKFVDENAKIWGKAFHCIYDGEVKKQDEEVEEVLEYSLEEIRQLIKNGEKITPDGLQAFEQFLKIKKLE